MKRMDDTLTWMKAIGLTVVNKKLLTEYSEAYISLKMIEVYLDECEENEETPDIKWLRRLIGGSGNDAGRT